MSRKGTGQLRLCSNDFTGLFGISSFPESPMRATRSPTVTSGSTCRIGQSLIFQPCDWCALQTPGRLAHAPLASYHRFPGSSPRFSCTDFSGVIQLYPCRGTFSAPATRGDPMTVAESCFFLLCPSVLWHALSCNNRIIKDVKGSLPHHLCRYRGCESSVKPSLPATNGIRIDGTWRSRPKVSHGVVSSHFLFLSGQESLLHG